MNEIIIEILKKFEVNGFKAYVVGGYVRDYLMKKESFDVDICTDALPNDIKKILNLTENASIYGSISFKIENYNFDITTFRKEIKYLNRKPTEIEFIEDLNTDILRRDFTINSICIDKDNNIIDYLDGIKDIKNKTIRLIGTDKKLREDPLRILRAIRFATILDFDIETNLHKAILEYKNFVSKIPLSRVKFEIDKILSNKNYKKGLNLLKKFDLLPILGIQYKSIVYTKDLCGMWAQIDVYLNYPFTKKERNNINKIKEILKDKVLDNYAIFKYGLNISKLASIILKRNIQDVIDIYNNLPLKSKNDLDISILEIKKIIKDVRYENAREIETEIVKKVLNGKLENKHDILVKFIRQKRG